MAAKKKIKDEEIEQEKVLPPCYGHYRTFGQPDCPKKVDCKYSKTCFLDEIFGALST